MLGFWTLLFQGAMGGDWSISRHKSQPELMSPESRRWWWEASVEVVQEVHTQSNVVQMLEPVNCHPIARAYEAKKMNLWIRLHIDFWCRFSQCHLLSVQSAGSYNNLFVCNTLLKGHWQQPRGMDGVKHLAQCLYFTADKKPLHSPPLPFRSSFWSQLHPHDTRPEHVLLLPYLAGHEGHSENQRFSPFHGENSWN